MGARGSQPLLLPRGLVCIDLQAYTTTQAPDRADILNVGGFSDAAFQVVSAFLSRDSGRFVREVEAVELPQGQQWPWGVVMTGQHVEPPGGAGSTNPGYGCKTNLMIRLR